MRQAQIQTKVTTKFDPHPSWVTHAVFGTDPSFNDVTHYFAYLRKIQSFSSKSEKWVWQKMEGEFGEALTPIWRSHLTNNLKVVLAG
jgi:hypothetical protein